MLLSPLFQSEALIGYAHWVLNTLLDPSKADTEHYLYNITKMDAVTVASVSLDKFNRKLAHSG